MSVMESNAGMEFMMTIEEIQKRLSDRRLSKVAKETGLSSQTLWRIRENKMVSVKYDTAIKLSEYFERHP